jgi:hypothetical protein
MQHFLRPENATSIASLFNKNKRKAKKKNKQLMHDVSNGSVLYGKFKQNHEKNDGTV